MDSFPSAEENVLMGSGIAPMPRSEMAPLSETGRNHVAPLSPPVTSPASISAVPMAEATTGNTETHAPSKVTESEERLRLALESADLASWDVDLCTGLATWNRQQLSQGIESHDGPISLSLWRRRVHPDDLAMVTSTLTRAKEDRQSFAVEHRIFRPDDGQLRWITLHGRFYYSEEGKAIRISGISRDITEQKETELRLAADLDAMTRLHSLSALSVVEGGTQAFLDQVLETALAIMEADFGNVQLLDRETGDLRIVAHRGFPDWWVEFWQTAAAHGSCGAAVAQGRRTIVEDLLESPLFPDGPGLEIQLRAGIRAVQSTPLISRSGAKLGTISTHFKAPHIPDERQLRLIDLLARQVADLIERAQAEEALRKAKTEAEAASLAKDKFIAALSHELRTPLMPVLIAASAYENDSECPAEIHKVFSMIRHNVELEKLLIDDLLDVARISEGKMHLQRQVCDLHSIIWDATRLLRSEMDSKKLDLRMELQAQNAKVMGDVRRLQQVVWNLLRNAIKFNPHGGLTILRSFQENAEVRLSITDTGIGIAAADLRRIFNAFEQSAAGATPRYGGLGLGLAISASIVAAHGGRIWAESEGEGQGATFHVAFPTADATASHTPHHPTLPAAGTRVEPLRILFVEDHEPTRTTLGYMLSRSGHQVKSADNIASALKLASQHAFDLVISDIGLPDGDGHQLMRQLQDRYGLSGIALSGFGRDDDIRRSSEAGFSTHLVKPVTIQMVEAALDKLLQPSA